MTVAELIEKLSHLPEGFQVILAGDAEGNRFSPLAENSLDVYVPENKWSGWLEDADDANDQTGENAVVLWPVN